MARRGRRSPGRTISAEQQMRMQEGRQKAREEWERTRERVEMLSELDARLAEGRRGADRTVPMLKPTRRHRRAK